MKTTKLISKTTTILVFTGLLGMALNASGQNLSVSNLNYNYDLRRPLHLNYQVIGNGTNSFVLFSFPMSMNSAKNYKFGYYLTNNLSEDPSVFVPLGEIAKYLQVDTPNKSIYGVRTATNGLSYFILSMTDTTQTTTYNYVCPVPETASRPSPDVLIYEEAVSGLFVGDYLPINTRVKFNSLFNKYQKYRVHYTSHKFEPALPPMSKPEVNTSLALAIDSIMNVQPLEVEQLSKEGLYIIYGDSSKNGLTLRIQSDSYPKLATVDELVESMVYLATKEEFDTIKTATNKKAQFDKFWLYNINSADKAKNTLSSYYSRVKEANILFTNYKEGWKTDKGMIYIIFGLPTKVIKEDNKEVWIYNKTFELPAITFTFIPVNTALAKEHYVLERSPEHKYVWFRAIELWRKGRKEI